jgi:cytidine deaminase
MGRADATTVGPMTTSSSSDDDEALLADARAARAAAYVPYSGFAMGAAVLSDSGAVFRGALVENVSLGLAMCAERVALFSTATAGERPTALVLVARRTGGSLTFPCGACLQVALELGGPDVRVVVSDPDGQTASSTVAELLPNGPHKPRG